MRRAFAVPVVIAVAALLVIAAGGAALAFVRPARPAAQAASLPADGHLTATLQVTSGTSLLSVGVANLGGTHGTLLQADTPASAPVHPELSETTAGTANHPGSPDAVLTLASGNNTGNNSRYTVAVTLNAAVTWRIVFAGGTERTVADLRGGRIAGLAFTAGSAVIDVTLPRPSGTVPILMTGGASQLDLRLPPAVPVQVTAGGGAGTVTLDGTAHTGVGGGTVFASPGWATAPARFAVVATAGAATISVTRYGS
jgi:hypothetical protein